jgi:hypothetical protein
MDSIQALAPVCRHCGCRIIGHGVEHGDTIQVVFNSGFHRRSFGVSIPSSLSLAPRPFYGHGLAERFGFDSLR